MMTRIAFASLLLFLAFDDTALGDRRGRVFFRNSGGGCTNCGVNSGFSNPTPVIRSSGCTNCQMNSGGFSTMGGQTGGFSGSSFSSVPQSGCRNCGISSLSQPNVARGQQGFSQGCTSCGINSASSTSSGNSNDCRYGDNENILICGDEILHRGPDRVFRKAESAATPSAGAATDSIAGAPATHDGDIAAAAPAVASEGSAEVAGGGGADTVSASNARGAGPSENETATANDTKPTAATKAPPTGDGAVSGVSLGNLTLPNLQPTPANAPYFKYAFPGDSFDGRGRCAATGVQLGKEITIPSRGSTKFCPAVTAAHCLDDIKGVAYDSLTGDSQVDVGVCWSKNASGAMSKVSTTLPNGKNTDAILLWPGGGGKSDLGVVLVPCDTGLANKLYQTGSGPAPLGLNAHLSFSQGGNQVRWTRNPSTSWRGRNGLPEFYRSFNGNDGSLSFNGPAGIQGDSGSPLFDGNKLAGVLTGVSSGRIGGKGSEAMATIALSLQDPGPSGDMNYNPSYDLGRDINRLIDGLNCGTPTEAIAAKEKIRKESAIAQTSPPSTSTPPGPTTKPSSNSARPQPGVAGVDRAPATQVAGTPAPQSKPASSSANEPLKVCDPKTGECSTLLGDVGFNKKKVAPTIAGVGPAVGSTPQPRSLTPNASKIPARTTSPVVQYAPSDPFKSIFDSNIEGRTIAGMSDVSQTIADERERAKTENRAPRKVIVVPSRPNGGCTYCEQLKKKLLANASDVRTNAIFLMIDVDAANSRQVLGQFYKPNSSITFGSGIEYDPSVSTGSVPGKNLTPNGLQQWFQRL